MVGNPLLSPFVAARTGPAYTRFSVPEPDRPRWEGRLADMEREQALRGDGWRDVVAALLQVTLVELARLATPYIPGLQQQGDTLLAEVFEVIEARHPERLGTADVAAAVGLTPSYLTTLVRQRTGRTVLDWILERRMAAARELLLASDLSAEEVARRVGFATRRTSTGASAPTTAWLRVAGAPRRAARSPRAEDVASPSASPHGRSTSRPG